MQALCISVGSEPTGTVAANPVASDARHGGIDVGKLIVRVNMIRHVNGDIAGEVLAAGEAGVKVRHLGSSCVGAVSGL